MSAFNTTALLAQFGAGRASALPGADKVTPAGVTAAGGGYSLSELPDLDSVEGVSLMQTIGGAVREHLPAGVLNVIDSIGGNPELEQRLVTHVENIQTIDHLLAQVGPQPAGGSGPVDVAGASAAPELSAEDIQQLQAARSEVEIQLARDAKAYAGWMMTAVGDALIDNYGMGDVKIGGSAQSGQATPMMASFAASPAAAGVARMNDTPSADSSSFMFGMSVDEANAVPAAGKELSLYVQRLSASMVMSVTELDYAVASHKLAVAEGNTAEAAKLENTVNERQQRTIGLVLAAERLQRVADTGQMSAEDAAIFATAQDAVGNSEMATALKELADENGSANISAEQLESVVTDEQIEEVVDEVRDVAEDLADDGHSEKFESLVDTIQLNAATLTDLNNSILDESLARSREHAETQARRDADARLMVAESRRAEDIARVESTERYAEHAALSSVAADMHDTHVVLARAYADGDANPDLPLKAVSAPPVRRSSS